MIKEKIINQMFEEAIIDQFDNSLKIEKAIDLTLQAVREEITRRIWHFDNSYLMKQTYSRAERDIRKDELTSLSEWIEPLEKAPEKHDKSFCPCGALKEDATMETCMNCHKLLEGDE